MNYTQLGEICNLWRNYGDIQDSWDSVLNIIDWFFNNQDVISLAAGPGRWNDPDMVSSSQSQTTQRQYLRTDSWNQSVQSFNELLNLIDLILYQSICRFILSLSVLCDQLKCKRRTGSDYSLFYDAPRNESSSTITSASCSIWVSSVATIMPLHFSHFFHRLLKSRKTSLSLVGTSGMTSPQCNE